MYELETSWLLRALVDDHHDIDFARLARLPTLIGPPNSAPSSSIPRHHMAAAPQARMHVASMHALSNFSHLCQRIAIIESLIRPHVIRRACHLLSHRHRLHMLDILRCLRPG